MDPIERSPSGRPVYRHRPREQRPFEPARRSGDDRGGRGARRPPRWVPSTGWHEVISDQVHLDVHVVEPTPQRLHRAAGDLRTRRPSMAVPQDAGLPSYAELLICLPPDWPRQQQNLADERNCWPIRWLRATGRLPHDRDAWLRSGRTCRTVTRGAVRGRYRLLRGAGGAAAAGGARRRRADSAGQPADRAVLAAAVVRRRARAQAGPGYRRVVRQGSTNTASPSWSPSPHVSLCSMSWPGSAGHDDVRPPRRSSP